MKNREASGAVQAMLLGAHRPSFFLVGTVLIARFFVRTLCVSGRNDKEQHILMELTCSSRQADSQAGQMTCGIGRQADRLSGLEESCRP